MVNFKTLRKLHFFWNFFCFVILTVVLVITKITCNDLELEDLLFVLFFRLGITFIVQVSGILLIKSIPARIKPILLPLPKDKSKDK